MLTFKTIAPNLRFLLLLVAGGLLFTNCYSYRIATHAQPGTEFQTRTAHSLFWGLVQSPKEITTPICDSLNVNGVSVVQVQNNFGYSLITVLTLGIWSPIKLQWKCGKPCQVSGHL
jgi:hypothetical protein